jgi:ABC-2 type transport system ATP-binding protein
MTAALETRALGKRFRRGWAVRECTLSIPVQAIVGLAGPNGAGKSTLLALAVALLTPTEGSISVLGRDPRADPESLDEIGYVAQDAPLYRSFTVGETLEFARRTNDRWDETLATGPLARLSSGDRVSALSAGERARLALGVALGKRPRLILLDEPFAKLDPRAGREFLQMLMDGVAETKATVVIASHVVADIERVADHIVVLSGGRVQLEGNVEELLASHRLLTGSKRPLGRIAGVTEVVRQSHSGRQMTMLARLSAPVVDPSWSVDEIRLEELLLGYMAPERLERTAHEKRRLRWHG